MEASPGSSHSTSREDRRLALADGFWDFLTMVLLGRMWEVRCVYSKHPRPPTWRANQLTPNHFSGGSPTGSAKQKWVRSPDQGFSPVEGHSDAQVRMRGIVLGNR